MDKYCGNMKRGFTPYTEEELAEIASRYDDLTEFTKKEPGAYDGVRRRGLFDKLCGHMKRKIRKDLTDEKLAEISARYDDLTEFQDKEGPTYTIICKRGLIDKLCGHMKRNRKVHWTDDELAEVASKYDVLGEFIEKELSVYHIICERGLKNKLCGHMQREYEEHRTKEELAAVAAKYDDLVEFKEKEPRTYSVIHNRGYYYELTAHMKRGHKPRYTDEELAEIASRYHSMQDFYTKEKGPFIVICRRGLIDKLCGHMERKGNLYKRKIYVFTFSDGYAYVGLSQDTKRRFRDHVSGRDGSPVYAHMKETGASFKFTELTDWLGTDVAAKMEDDYIQQYVADGWKMLNRARGGALGSLTAFYTDARIKEEAGKYEYLEDFRENSPYFYRYIRRHHLFDKYCTHMTHKKRTPTRWTVELAIKAAQGCKNRSELHVKNYQAYRLLSDAGLLDRYLPKRTTLTSESQPDV